MATKEELQATIEALQRQVDEVLLVLDDIKQGIINNGVEVADGTPVSQYRLLIETGKSTTIYVVSNPIEVTLEASKWNGTTYELTLTEYGEAHNVQIGIPPNSSIVNAQILKECALTVPEFTNNYTKTDTDGDGTKETNIYTSTTIVISAITAPTSDVVVAIYGFNTTTEVAE